MSWTHRHSSQPLTLAPQREAGRLFVLLAGIQFTLFALPSIAPGASAPWAGEASSQDAISSASGPLDGDRFSVNPGSLWRGASSETTWHWQASAVQPRVVGSILQITGDHPFVLRNAPRNHHWEFTEDHITWSELPGTRVADDPRTIRIHRLERAVRARGLRWVIDSAHDSAPVIRHVEFGPRIDTAFAVPEWVAVVNVTHDPNLPGHGQEFIPLARSASLPKTLEAQQVWLTSFTPAFLEIEPRPLAAFLSGSFKDWCEVDRSHWRGIEAVVRSRALPIWASCGGAQGLALAAHYGTQQPWDCPHCRDPMNPRTPLYGHIGHTGTRPCGDYSACVFERGPHRIRTVGADPVFDRLGSEFVAMESHCGQIEWVPPGWRLVATAGTGTSTEVQCLRLIDAPIYAAQFHIEMAGTPEVSERIMSNFLQQARRW